MLCSVVNPLTCRIINLQLLFAPFSSSCLQVWAWLMLHIIMFINEFLKSAQIKQNISNRLDHLKSLLAVVLYDTVKTPKGQADAVMEIQLL